MAVFHMLGIDVVFSPLITCYVDGYTRPSDASSSFHLYIPFPGVMI